MHRTLCFVSHLPSPYSIMTSLIFLLLCSQFPIESVSYSFSTLFCFNLLYICPPILSILFAVQGDHVNNFEDMSRNKVYYFLVGAQNRGCESSRFLYVLVLMAMEATHKDSIAIIWKYIFFTDFIYLVVERGEGSKKERGGISTRPATQAYALPGN